MGSPRTPDFDYHIHSKYSYDGVMEPRDIVRLASKRGLDRISITDHGTIAGSLKARDCAHEFGIEVRIGIEVRTNSGDILGIDISENVQEGKWEDVLDDIRNQGGLSILAHPFRGGRLTEEVGRNCDLIEAFNCRSSPAQNARAAELTQRLHKPKLAGSDAHVWSEVGRAHNRGHDLMTGEIIYEGRPARRAEYAFSYLVGDIRRRKPGQIPYHLSCLFRP